MQRDDTTVAASWGSASTLAPPPPRRVPLVRWVDNAIRRHGLALAALTFVAVIAYGTALATHPLLLDNLVYFSLGAKPDPSSFFTDTFGTFLPAYRPLGTLTFWLQYQYAGLTTEHYFAFNILAWLAVGVALYVLVQRLSGSRLAGAFAGLFLLVDDRVNIVIWNLTERQNALACLFGLLALLIIFGSYRERHTRVAAVGIFGLLLAAGLSKEYGLVFSAAAVVAALTMRGPGWKLDRSGERRCGRCLCRPPSGAGRWGEPALL